MLAAMTKRLHEAGRIAVEASTPGSAMTFRVCLIQEGKGSSASFPREFFTSENGDALAEALSFPGHPEYIWAPENRDPLSVIGKIGSTVTIEEHDNRMGFWSDYNVSKSRPEVGAYLAEYGADLGLSIYIDSDGYIDDVTGTYVATAIDGSDPYKSVDLVVAAGAGGKFDRVAEGLRRITEASANAGEREVHMDKEIESKFDAITKAVESLTTALEGKAKADAQAEADSTAVKTAVESRLTEYDKAVDLITEAKLTESQSASLREMAKQGVDIAPHVESAKQVLAEALALAAPKGDDDTHGRIAEHLGGGNDNGGSDDFSVSGFGKVS